MRTVVQEVLEEDYKVRSYAEAKQLYSDQGSLPVLY
jgi:transposase InsO family protein